MAVTEAAEDETVYKETLFATTLQGERWNNVYLSKRGQLHPHACTPTRTQRSVAAMNYGSFAMMPGLLEKLQKPKVSYYHRNCQNILANKIRKFGGLILKPWNVARRSTCKRCRADAERRPAACKQPKCWLTAAPTAAGSTYCSPASENTLQRHLSKGLLGDTTVVMDTRPASAHAINDE